MLLDFFKTVSKAKFLPELIVFFFYLFMVYCSVCPVRPLLHMGEQSSCLNKHSIWYPAVEFMNVLSKWQFCGFLYFVVTIFLNIWTQTALKMRTELPCNLSVFSINLVWWKRLQTINQLVLHMNIVRFMMLFFFHCFFVLCKSTTWVRVRRRSNYIIYFFIFEVLALLHRCLRWNGNLLMCSWWKWATQSESRCLF